MWRKRQPYIRAGDAYKAAGDNAKAYDSFLKAYQIRAANGASKSELREVLFKMQEVAAPGSPEKDEVDKAIANQL